MPATFREAVRGLQGASLDIGLLLFLFQASRQLRLLSVDSVQRTVPDAVGWGWELENKLLAEELADHLEARACTRKGIT